MYHELPEDKARHDLINPALRKAGWDIQHFKSANIYAAKGVAVEFFQLGSGVGEADYVLFVVGKACGIIEAKKENVNLKFVYYQMALVKVNTTTHKRYYISFYQNMKFLFPKNKDGSIDFKKQEEIIEEIESRFSVVDKLEQTIDASLDKAEQLRKSILKSAFEGKLVKENGQSNYN